MKIQFSIDSAQTRDALLMGWGWFLSGHSANKCIDINLGFIDGSEQRVPCFINRARDDVVQAFPDNSHASAAGFIFLAKLNTPVKISGAELLVELTNGERFQLPLPGFPERFSPDSAAPLVVMTRMQKAWRLIRSGRVSYVILRSKSLLGTWLANRPKPSNKTMAEKAEYELIFDHRLGGGANQFCDAKTAEFIRLGKSVLLVRFDLPRLQYRLEFHNQDGVAAEAASDMAMLKQRLASYRYAAIHVNNLVSYPDPDAMACYIAELAGTHKTRLIIYLHDYLPICPSYTLINADQVYCGVPGREVCRVCLSRNSSIFPSFVALDDILPWRKTWSELFQAATKVIAFSEAALSIYQKAFPELIAQVKVAVEPHKVDSEGYPKIVPQLGAPLRIAVIGHITQAKGAQIINDLLHLIEQRALAMQVIIIGTLDRYVASPFLEVTGPFQHDDLPRLLQKYRIGICWLPSICPETFSYVTEEIISMELPLVCFDLGAPADRAIKYARGEVAESISAESALDAIMALASRLSAVKTL